MQKQKYLKEFGLIVFLVILDMSIPLSTDIYLPALPTMQAYFNTTPSILNFTLTSFLFFYAVGILFCGPISDKYGRKPTLIIGITLYVIASFACASAENVYSLIGFRAIQALCGGSMLVVSTAVIKESFETNKRNVMLAWIQVLTIIAPLIAPVVGAVLLEYFSWRSNFVVLALFGLAALFMAFFFQETLPKEKRVSDNIFNLANRLIGVTKVPGFSLFLNSFAIFGLPFMAFLALSSYIFIEYFTLTPIQYSLFLAVNSLLGIIGGAIYVKICNKIQPRKILNVCIFLFLLSSFLVPLFAKISPIYMLAVLAPFIIVESISRPCNIAVLLEQQDDDNGCVSSVINSVHFLWGVIGLLIASLKWGNFIDGLGIIMIVCSILSLGMWIYLLKSKKQVKTL